MTFSSIHRRTVVMKRLVFLVLAVAGGAVVWYGFHRRPPRPAGLPATVAEFKGMPGGATTVDAADYLISRLHQGALPGFSKDDHGSLVAPNMKPPQEQTEAYPILRIVCLHKNGDTSEYYYWVVRASKGAPWQLQKAWRASPDGRVLEEYPLEYAHRSD